MEADKQTLDSSTGLTCMTCRLVFGSSEIQREHYKSEWHRYNVKRVVASLPPISETDFTAKVKTFDSAASSTTAPTSETSFCENCKKPFQSKNAYINHINSKKHKKLRTTLENAGSGSDEDVAINSPNLELNTRAFDAYSVASNDSGSSGWRTVDSGEDEDEDEIEYDESKAIPETSCLFCKVASSSADQNIVHMSNKHGFSIPDSEYCSNVVGLLNYLGSKIGCGNYCIACSSNAKRFRCMESCKKHMRDKNHCYFNTEGENIVEYIDYYDYSSLLTEGGDLPENDDALIDEGAFLVLPSGAKVGHRTLMRYFKQSLKPEKASFVDKYKQNKALFAGGFKSLGWTGVSGVAAVQKARDMKFMRKVVDHYRLKQGVGANRLFKTRGRKDQQ